MPVDGDVVERGELARLPPRTAEAGEDVLRCALDDAHLAVHPVGHVDEPLLAVGREHQVVDRAGASRALLEDVLGDEAAVLAENLQPVVGAVADVDQAFRGKPDAVHRIRELQGRRSCGIVGRRLLVARRLAVSAPVALVGAALGIEHHDAPVGIAVGGEDLPGGDVDRDVGRRAEPHGRVAVVPRSLPADLQDELAVHRELEQLAVFLAVPGQPDEIAGVDEDAVLALGPLVARPRAAPGKKQVAGLVERQHRRRGDAALAGRRNLLGGPLALGERARPVHDPDGIEAVGRDAGHLPQDPAVRQRLRPERIDLELRHSLRERRRGEGCERDSQQCDPGSHVPASPPENPRGSYSDAGLLSVAGVKLIQ